MMPVSVIKMPDDRNGMMMSARTVHQTAGTPRPCSQSMSGGAKASVAVMANKVVMRMLVSEMARNTSSLRAMSFCTFFFGCSPSSSARESVSALSAERTRYTTSSTTRMATKMMMATR